MLARFRSSRVGAAGVLLGALIAGNAVRGGVDLAATVLTLCAATIALWMAARVRRHRAAHDSPESERDPSVPLLPVVMAAATAVVALQLVPLPPSVVRVLFPGTAALFDDSLAPLGLWPSWRPISLDPAETALQLAIGAAVTAACASAALASYRKSRAEAILKAVSLSALGAAGAALVGAAFGLSPLLESRTTFVNPNNLAGFLQLGAWPALGFGMRATGRARIAWFATFALTSLGLFLSLSRAGIASFFLASAIFAFLATRGRHAALAARLDQPDTVRGRRRALLRATATPLAVLAALAIASWIALDRIVAEMATAERAASDVKVALWPDAVRLIGRFPLLGIGRGAFATVYPAWKTIPEQMTFTHLENSWLQIPLDLGVGAGLALIGAFAWAFVAAARSRELSRPMMGALAGTAAVAAQNVFDFSFDIPGVALPFAIVLGIAARSMPAVRVRPRAVRVLAVVALALGGAGLAVHASHRADRVAQSINSADGIDRALTLAKDSLRWHPADWVPHAAMGVQLVRAGFCGQGMEWLVRAMLRNPTAPEPHRYAARCLAAAGRNDEAKLEYRLAHLYSDWSALREAFARYPSPGELVEIAPQTPDGLLAAARILADRPTESREAYRRLWEGFLDVRGLAGLVDCSLRTGPPEETLRLARQLEQLSSLLPQGYLVASHALDALGDLAAAQAELELGVSRIPGDPILLAALGTRELKAQRPTQARALFERIVARDPIQLSRKKLLLASALGAQGRIQEALAEAQDAFATDRTSVAALEVVARYATAAGRYDVAVDALEQAARASRDSGVYDAQLAQLRQRQRLGPQRLDEGAER